jgi:hypothetical protein
MSLVCNKQQQITAKGATQGMYRDSEICIESGSAYFAQAFAEALGLVSDIELHDTERAKLRLQSMGCLLEHALQQYGTASELGIENGLNAYHEKKLREEGLNFEGIRKVLDEAQNREFLREKDERINTLAATLDRQGYSDLMSLYVAQVRDIHKLAAKLGASEEFGADSVAWQELGWKLTTLFAEALEVGKAIAILNTLTFRLPADILTSQKPRLS